MQGPAERSCQDLQKLQELTMQEPVLLVMMPMLLLMLMQMEMQQ
jgi:hypothetical protein